MTGPGDSRRLFARFPLGQPRISTVPPAFSTAATADFDAPCTESVTLALSSPAPRSRTPSLARRKIPAFTKAAASILARQIEPPGVDRLLETSEIDLVELERELNVAEAALGQAAMQRHLAALEALDAHARSRGLALAAASAGLALAGADTAADALSRLARAGAAARVREVSSSLLHHANQMRDLGDHAARRRRIDQFGDAADLVQLQADQRLTLGMLPAQRAADLSRP